MGNEIDLVRYRNDGDDFHVLWTARRALRMLDPKSGLVAVAVEGPSEREQGSGPPIEPGLLVIDTTEYYGSEHLREASEVVYCQLKYSTTTPDKHWTVSGLSDTLQGFAQRYSALRTEEPSALDKVRFRFVSNRPISGDVLKVFDAVVAGKPLPMDAKRAQTAYKALLRAMRLSAKEFATFAARVDLWGNQEASGSQARGIAVEINRYTAVLDSDVSMRMKALVREKTLSQAKTDNTIRLDTLLQQFGLGNERELLPCEPQFETLADPIRRKQESEIASAILAGRWPVVIGAPAGVGKTVLAQRLPAYLPAGSEAIVFDGFAGGDYRNARLYRHKHAKGLVHIANELARLGLCDLLIPQRGASEQEYLNAFRNRVEQATAVVRARSSEAVVLIVIDAADNLGMAAEEAHDRSFVPDLLREQPAKGSHIVALARDHRIERYLKPSRECVRLDLEPFDLEDSAQHLRRKFPDATDRYVEAFHRFTDRNARVQANALTVAPDLPTLMNSLGPSVKTVQDLITDQLSTALNKVIEEQALSRAELEPLCIALAALPPPMPLGILARAAAMPENAVRSFIYDFAHGRPIVINDNLVQFRDEPVETWFHDQFLGTPAQAGAMADRLTSLATTDAYAAAVLPIVLHRAGRHAELMKLALEGPEPETADPVERREVLLQRVQYALKAALARDDLGDVTRLLLRAGEEVAASDRQSRLFMEHADLVAALAGSEAVNDFIFRRRAWDISDTGYVYCAVMLSADPRKHVEARRFLSLAVLWLKDWFAEQRKQPTDEPLLQRTKMEEDDIAAYAEAIRSLDGSAALVRFMKNWRDWAAFEAMGIVVSRLIDREDTASLQELMSAVGNRVALRLAILLEMNRVGSVPARPFVTRTIKLLSTDATQVSLGEYRDQSEIWPAIAATWEAAMRCKVPAAELLPAMQRYPIPNERVYSWYDRGGRRDAVFKAAGLRAVLEQRTLTLDDVAPASVLQARKKPGAEHDSDVREFNEVYGALVPWYALRARALAGPLPDWDSLVTAARKDCRTRSWGWGSSQESVMVVNDIGELWFQAAVWSARARDECAVEVQSWLLEQDVMITIPTWTGLARLASHQHGSCLAGALRFASHSRELIEGEHGDAAQTANSLVTLARALLPIGREEASAYLERALQHLSRLGDELHERLFVILALARKAAESGVPDARQAYRVARIGELFHAYDDHKFPWADVIDAVTHLFPSSGFAVASRWNDRGRVPLSRTLPSVVLRLLETRTLSPTVAAALHAFGGYWRLRHEAGLFFPSDLGPTRMQAVVDTLAIDLEFERDRDGDTPNELVREAKAHRLECQRLEDLVQFHAQLPQRGQELRPERLSQSENEQSEPDWSQLLRGIDPHGPEGVDEATRRRKATKGPSDPDLFLLGIRRQVDASRRMEHVFALSRSRELRLSLVLKGLEACLKDWGDSLAVRKALREAIQEMLIERARELIVSPWGLDERVRQCSALSGLTPEAVLRSLMNSMAEQVQFVSGSALFNLARALTDALTPSQASGALAFGLDRVEPIFKEDDGDGPWHDGLAPPPQVPSAVAHLLYAMLASPVAEMRWRAAHAVRRLGRFDEASIIADLVRLLRLESPAAFHDRQLPFYVLHARLYALIAFARAADESSQSLMPHASELVAWALAPEPHVLLRHFAKAAVLALQKVQPGVLDEQTLQRVKAVDISPFPPAPRQNQSRQGWSGKSSGSADLGFDYDFDRYWLDPLAAAFNVSYDEVATRARKWVRAQGGKANYTHWIEDPRARRNIYGEGTSASHGTYPSIDRHSFYLSYHAMLYTAGELLSTFPASSEYSRNGWVEWLQGHVLTRDDGKWLVDRRDLEPLEMRPWQREADGWARRAEWKYSVQAADLDEALGVREGETQQLVIAGSWSVRSGERRETIHVHSALVSRESSMALLRALQTADRPQGYRIPRERDDAEVDLPGFRLCGWTEVPYRSGGLDEFDPFAGKIRWPGPVLGRRARRLPRLTKTDDGRHWRLNAVNVVTAQIWGDRKDERYRPAGNHGDRLVADLGFLLTSLRRIDSDLIVEVEVERKYGSKEEIGDPEVDFAHQGYSRIYVIRADGELHTLHGRRRLRS